METQPRIVFLTNIVAPYRLALMERLCRSFEVYVLYSGVESNRREWTGLADRADGRLHLKRSWGVVLQRRAKRGHSTFDHQFLHITPGYITDLALLRPAALISAGLGARTIIALLYSMISGAKLWVHWGGTLHTEAHRSRLTRVVRKLLVPLVPRWLSYGESATEYLLSVGVPKDRILQSQNGVDDELYKRSVAPSLTLSTRPVLLTVGRLVPLKGLDLLLRVVAKLQLERHAFTTVIVGSGMEAEPLRKLASQLGIQDLHFVAAIPPEQLPALYRSADLLVFPTLEDIWGLVINEALLSGVPVLASKYAGGTRELVPVDLSFDPLDAADFLNKLRRIITNIPAADASRVRSMDDVAEDIRRDILRQIGSADKLNTECVPPHSRS